MIITNSDFSCGVKQIAGLGGLTVNKFRAELKDYVKEEIKRRANVGDGGGAHSVNSKIGFVFSDSDESGRGINVAKWIAEEGIGRITEGRPWKNYNTGRTIRCWAFYTTRKFMDECLDRKAPPVRR